MAEPSSRADSTDGPGSDMRIGSYRIIQPLGTGGMSSVYRAVHVETGHEVALKVLTRTLARNSTLLQRFLREARSAETLEHANIVTIYDRGIDKGRHYLVLEYVAGGDFHEYVHRRGPLAVADAVVVVKDVARALRYAAGRGLIHRDIKPSNILRTPAGHIKLIDLGLALQAEKEDERVTREGTTVGTVDYMAPEQARDSRATSIQSDMYSLGCTFYFLLTGVPPFPGGDITEKLTRHAKAPVPDVADLRQDVPPAIGAILSRMMAKRPDDRFASYDDLIRALEEAPLGQKEENRGIALLPYSAATEAYLPVSDDEATPESEREESEGADAGGEGAYDVVSLADLAADLGETSHPSPAARPASIEAPIPLLRRSSVVGDDDVDAVASDADGIPSAAPGRSPGSATIWMLSSVVIGVVCVLVAIGLTQYVGTSDGPDQDALSADPDSAADMDRAISPPRTGLATTAVRLANPASGKQSSVAEAKARWVEEQDTEAPPAESPSSLAESEARAKRLPDWARAPIPDRIEGPFVVVRRVAESGDATAVPTLHMALDRNIGGTVELADDGPHYINDLRVPGESRLIRARPGYRPIVVIDQPKLGVVTQQPAVFTLAGKNLILDGIDLIVNVRELPPTQTALFSCAGATLTLRNCSITILNNPDVSSFVFVRTESTSAQPNPSRIRLEKTLVRGSFAAGFDLARGSTELVLHQSVILGGPGPSIRSEGTQGATGNRLFIVETILAGPGPIIERTAPAWTSSSSRTRPLFVRAFGSAFGRFHGAGISSVIFSTGSAPAADRQIDWAGDQNLFAGWKGFFACGKELAVTVEDLAAIRSTWSATDQGSREVLSPWPTPLNLAFTTAGELRPFVPHQESILRQVALPRSGLFEKTIDEYRSPEPPVAAGWAMERVATIGAGDRFARRGQGIDPEALRNLAQKSRRPPTSREQPRAEGGSELTFDTAAPPWNGDLGAFLKDRMIPGTEHARVRVTGSGRHRFTPVRLPAGLWLEIRVEPLSEAEPPSWLPQPEATGPALIELRGGALVLSNIVLEHEESSRLDQLIQVEDGHLIISHSRLISRKSADNFAGNLIGFRALTTEPKSSDLSALIFRGPVDRPVCRLDDSALITDGIAVKAELGRGLVAIEQCAIAAAVAAVELIPAKVSRRRFDVDLWLDHCTLISERSLIRLGPWPGLPPGPDRPWLITSRNCAYLALSDQRPRETVLLRADADALARGAVFWQEADDVIDVDFFQAAGEDPPINTSRTREFQHQWVDFWGANHIKRVSGPRGARSAPGVRLKGRVRPGRIEPVDLVLDPDYHPGRDQLNVGANLLRQAADGNAAPAGVGNAPKLRRRPLSPASSGAAVPF